MQVVPKARYDAVLVTKENFHKVAEELPFLELEKDGEYYQRVDEHNCIWGVFPPVYIVYSDDTFVDECSPESLREDYYVGEELDI